MSKKDDSSQPEAWHVLVVGLPLVDNEYELGESLTLRKLVRPISVFDLAAAGAVGFREWNVLEPIAPGATAEIISPTKASTVPGYDALNKCWLASALLVLRGFVRHICPAVSSYSWNFVAGHQSQTSEIFRQQLFTEGVEKAVYEPKGSLPPFQGGLLDYHLSLLLPDETKNDPLDASEARWIAKHFQRFNLLAAENKSFRFALEASVDWRYVKDCRAALSRLWAGIEAIFGISHELVFRISLLASTILGPRGHERVEAFHKIKKLYDLRSKAVHGVPISEDKLMNGVYGSYDLLRTLLLDAVTHGRLRSQEDFLNELLS